LFVVPKNNNRSTEGGKNVNNLAVGIELLFTGMTITFLVLVFLMYIMKATSALVAKQEVSKGEPAKVTPLPVQVPSDGLADDELVAIMAALGKVLPANQQAVVRVAPQTTTGVAEDELVAAIAGAVAAR
jgi:sodium pump decarboxylase gamma subunit